MHFKNRLIRKKEDEIRNYQAGFREGLWIMDQVFTLCQKNTGRESWISEGYDRTIQSAEWVESE